MIPDRVPDRTAIYRVTVVIWIPRFAVLTIIARTLFNLQDLAERRGSPRGLRRKCFAPDIADLHFTFAIYSLAGTVKLANIRISCGWQVGTHSEGW
jgi:hypothetical protein